MASESLGDWTVLITGGGSGIGLGCARHFLADGATVTLMGRDQARLEAARDQLGDAAERVRIAPGDVAEEDDVERAVAIASDDGKRLDIAVACAGRGTLAPVISQSAEDFDGVMRSNLYGTLHTFKHAGRVIGRSGGGALCAISSIAGARTHRCGGAYGASKAAIDMLVQTMADEMGPVNVRVNSVLPGLVETDLSQGLQDDPTMLEDYLDCMPVRRTGTVDDVARAVRFLCGPESAWITGVLLNVDGGQHLRRGPLWDELYTRAMGDYLADARA